MKRVLVTGITGQDGAYFDEFLQVCSTGISQMQLRHRNNNAPE
jgi:GDP-D-mannose dehydratase